MRINNQEIPNISLDDISELLLKGNEWKLLTQCEITYLIHINEYRLSLMQKGGQKTFIRNPECKLMNQK